MALRSISLCAGVGGIDLGLRLAADVRTVCYVEWGKFPAAVLDPRRDDGGRDDAPVWDDVGTFDGQPWRGAVDLVVAGFPCQPVSLAGKRLGMDDHRFIWDDIARIIGEVEPAYVFLENVPGILTADGGAFLDRVLSSLVILGFDCEWDVFSAEETGAPHRRQRWFCLAYTNHPRRQARDAQPFTSEPGRRTADLRCSSLGHHNGAGREEHGGAVAVRPEQPSAERPVGLVGHAEGGTRLRAAPGRGGHPAQPDQEPVANARFQQERELDPQDNADSGQWEAWRTPVSGGGRVYPPARNDRAGWAAVEASLEPAVCRDADGLAAGLDPALFAYRQDRLRAVGNGVVPLTAAIAWHELMRRAGGLI